MDIIQKIHWLGHSGFKIKAAKTIYIDPFRIKDDEPADLILITHDHFDHFSPEDIEKIKTKKTIIITPPNCEQKLKGEIKIMAPYRALVIDGIKIETVAAYNINKEFHPKQKNWVGYILNIEGKRAYHAGDTDNIPEMKNLKDIDVAMLPVSGTYVMNPDEAAEAAKSVNPKIAIPMHYGTIIGTRADAERFKSLCKCSVKIFD